MILVDFNQALIASGMVESKGKTISLDLMRHVALKILKSYGKKFHAQYGELVICCDSKHFWRKEIFPHYKASRKKKREESPIDWNVMFQNIDTLKAEFNGVLPYRIVESDRLEADDIIASLIKYYPGPHIIISSDRDFLQLQKYTDVDQWSPMSGEFLKCPDPSQYAATHIIKGDSGDGIPNILSPDDVFVTEGTRQKSITTKSLDAWSRMPPSVFCSNDVMTHGYARNQALISLFHIPENLMLQAKNAFENAPVGNIRVLFEYMISHRLTTHLSNIQEFNNARTNATHQ